MKRGFLAKFILGCLLIMGISVSGIAVLASGEPSKYIDDHQVFSENWTSLDLYGNPVDTWSTFDGVFESNGITNHTYYDYRVRYYPDWYSGRLNKKSAERISSETYTTHMGNKVIHERWVGHYYGYIYKE